jgi:hypothetical protein
MFIKKVDKLILEKIPWSNLRCLLLEIYHHILDCDKMSENR